MKVADFTNQTSPTLNVRVSYSSAADLLCALWIVGGRRHDDALADLDLGDEWFEEFEAALSPATNHDLDAIGCGDAWVALVPLLPEAGEGSTVTAFIDYLAALEPADIRYRLMTVYDLMAEVDRDIVADAAEGVAEAVAKLLDEPVLARPDMKQWRASLQYLLELPPGETQDVLVRVLRGAHQEAFAESEEAFRPFLETDFRSRRAMARRMNPARLLEVATSGVNLSGEHARKPIVLMPTMVARPWNIMAEGSDYLVVGYPVGDEYLDSDSDAPPQWLVKLHKALGDERRLRVLRTLAHGDASLGDLAEQADIAKSTMHHHLMLLRAAGLVRIHVGDDKRYSLREETLADASTMLDHYIHSTSYTKEGP